ncbi:hypothetical protein ACLOJK_020226 [Asimina triloba]
MAVIFHTGKRMVFPTRWFFSVFMFGKVTFVIFFLVTSSRVWINLPAATSLIVFLRYISYDLEMRRKSAAYSKPSPVNNPTQKISLESPKIGLQKSKWRRKVNSPIVEAAIDQLTRHLVTEWVADLWYSRITTDTDGPEELVQIMNDVLGEVSFRAREINLIDLLTRFNFDVLFTKLFINTMWCRDIVSLICNHLELYRACQAKIGKNESSSMPLGHHDEQLKLVLASENKLHPALFSAEAEHKVLQHLMGGLIALTFKAEDLQCSFFRYTVRELLACVVMRPVLNLVNPRFINEKIESLMLSSRKKTEKGAMSSQQEASESKPSSRTSSDYFSGFLDRTNNGVELVQFKHDYPGNASGEAAKRFANGMKSSGTHGDVPQSQSMSSDPLGLLSDQNKCGEWGQMLDALSRRKTQALAPEHLENMWTKGRDYKRNEVTSQLTKQAKPNSSPRNTLDHLKATPKHETHDETLEADTSRRNTAYPPQKVPHILENAHAHGDRIIQSQPVITSCQEKQENDPLFLKEYELESETSYSSEDDESNNVTGLDSPGTKVWDSKNTRHAHIRHPLESSDGHVTKKSNKGHSRYRRLSKSHSARKRFRPGGQRVPTWQEVERTTLSVGAGQNILNLSKHGMKLEESTDDSDFESRGRAHSGAGASSSAPSTSISEAHSSALRSSATSVLADSFLKLRCEVLGANIVKSGSKTFAVYAISVTDAGGNSWSIKRRFRHFEELHRRLKEFSEYNLSLPPKHFLSTGLEVSVIRERYASVCVTQTHCYVIGSQKLLHLPPTISGSIEVWDFLSVDSQTYLFSNSLSIIETLSVDLAAKPYERQAKGSNLMEGANDQFFSRKEPLGTSGQDCSLLVKQKHEPESSELMSRNFERFPGKSSGKVSKSTFDDNSGSDSDGRLEKDVSSLIKPGKALEKSERVTVDNTQESQSLIEVADDPTLPTEWVPPNLSVPILDLVDVIFQLQDGGWIRRQVFWVAKQVLQLGMGDAFDDWLIEKIQLLRKGSVIASLIKRIEQILWPDGIFLTKHPRRQRPSPAVTPTSCNSPVTVSTIRNEAQKNSGKEHNLSIDEHQEFEAAQRAKFVYELIIGKSTLHLLISIEKQNLLHSSVSSHLSLCISAVKAPAALVGLVGQKVYERCAQDIYYFLQGVCRGEHAMGKGNDVMEMFRSQAIASGGVGFSLDLFLWVSSGKSSPLCLKQLAFDLLELLLLSAFPELDGVIKKCHEDKERFGVVEVK